MTEKEVAELLREIEILYPGRIKPEERAPRFKTFKRLLKDHDAELVTENLYRHVEESPFPPAVADLVKRPMKSMVPSVEETLERFKQYEPKPETEEHKRVREEAQAQIAEILGLNKKDDDLDI